MNSTVQGLPLSSHRESCGRPRASLKVHTSDIVNEYHLHFSLCSHIWKIEFGRPKIYSFDPSPCFTPSLLLFETMKAKSFCEWPDMCMSYYRCVNLQKKNYLTFPTYNWIYCQIRTVQINLRSRETSMPIWPSWTFLLFASSVLQNRYANPWFIAFYFLRRILCSNKNFNLLSLWCNLSIMERIDDREGDRNIEK